MAIRVSKRKSSHFQLTYFLVFLVFVAASVLQHTMFFGHLRLGPDTLAAPSTDGTRWIRDTLEAPFQGCVFVLSPVQFEGFTPVYRESFVQWYADFLMRSLGAQTNQGFQALVPPGFTRSELALLRRRIHPNRHLLRPNLVVVDESVGATATRLVQASNCSWVVSVGIDADDAVAPFFVQDLLETAYRWIRRVERSVTAAPAVRAVLIIQRNVTAVRVDRGDDEDGIRCRVVHPKR